MNHEDPIGRSGLQRSTLVRRFVAGAVCVMLALAAVATSTPAGAADPTVYCGNVEAVTYRDRYVPSGTSAYQPVYLPGGVLYFTSADYAHMPGQGTPLQAEEWFIGWETSVGTGTFFEFRMTSASTGWKRTQVTWCRP